MSKAECLVVFIFNFSYRLREHGILIGRDGPDENVLKIKPPLVINKNDIDLFIRKFDQVLTDL